MNPQQYKSATKSGQPKFCQETLKYIEASPKRLIAFDLDDTLATTKQPISEQMADLLNELAKYYEICVITGGRYDQVQANLVSRLAPEVLKQFHLMPLNGVHYYRFSPSRKKWDKTAFIDDLTELECQRIHDALKESATQLGYWEEDPTGEIIDNRGTQLTYSALGQLAKPEDKYSWDSDFTKRQKIHKAVTKALPEYEIRINGNTSIDVTRQGCDKGFGIQKLSEIAQLNLEDILFFGDQLHEAGNDYPVKQLGVETVAVERWEDTAEAANVLIETIKREDR